MDRFSTLLVIVLIFLFCAPFALRAQIATGLGGGGGFTRNTGFRAALPLEYGIRKNVYIHSGVAIIQRRNLEIIRKLGNGRDYLSVATDYLSLPILLKLRLDWQPVRLYGLIGAEINYGLRLQASGLEDMRLFRETLSFDPLGLRRWDAGLCIGGGVEKDIHRRRKIFADIRYYQGITDMDRSAASEIYNDGVFVTLGFLLPL